MSQLTVDDRGNEIGPFRAIEESTIAHLTDKEHRSDIYAWYSLIGTAGTALGFVGCGWLVTYMHEVKHHGIITTYQTIFFIYAGVGLLKMCLAFMLSSACELDAKPKPAAVIASSAGERAPLLGNNTTAHDQDSVEPPKKKRGWSLLPDVSKESQVVLVQLCVLFAFDNLASGLAPL
jgi:MFS family permease